MIGTSKDIKDPGLRKLPPGVERYFVRGGGLSVIEVSPQDKIEIIKGVELNEFAKSKIQVTTDELESEREAVADLI